MRRADIVACQSKVMAARAAAAAYRSMVMDVRAAAAACQNTVMDVRGISFVLWLLQFEVMKIVSQNVEEKYALY